MTAACAPSDARKLPQSGRDAAGDLQPRVGRAPGAPSHRRREPGLSPRVPLEPGRGWRVAGVTAVAVAVPPPRAMTCCGMTTRRSWPTKPCGSWRITWLSSATSRCPPARSGWVGDKGGHEGSLLTFLPPGAHRQARPKARGLRQRPAPPGGSAELQEKGRGQNRQGWDLPAPPGTVPVWGQSPRPWGQSHGPPVSLPQAEEEFNKAQAVFEDLNRDLREELPVLYGRYGAVPAAGDTEGAWGHSGACGDTAGIAGWETSQELGGITGWGVGGH